MTAAPVDDLSPVDIAVEFFEQPRPLDDAQIESLIGRGIPAAALDSDPGRPAAPVRAARVTFAGKYFDFAEEHDEDARAALVVIARDQFGVVDDIVAFDAKGNVGTWLGRAAMLGEQMRYYPRIESPALRIFRDPWEWLRGERRGVVILDPQRARWRLSGDMLAVDDRGFGCQIRRALALPASRVFFLARETA